MSSEFNDAPLGLVYYNWRYYNTQDGKWIRRDPKGYKASLNYYGYVHNNPLNTDYLGLWSLFGRNFAIGVGVSVEGCIYVPKILGNVCLSGSVSVGMTACCDGGEDKIATRTSWEIAGIVRFTYPINTFTLSVSVPVDIDAIPKSKEPCPYSSNFEIIPKLFLEANVSIGFFDFSVGVAVEFKDGNVSAEIYGNAGADIFNSDDTIGESRVTGVSVGAAIEGEGITVSRRDELIE